MKIITSMIARKGKEYYMLEAYCPQCGYKKTVPIDKKNINLRCLDCKRKLRFRWISIGNKIDYTEYFTEKTNRRMRQGKPFTW